MLATNFFNISASIIFIIFFIIINPPTVSSADSSCDEQERNIDGTVKQVLLMNLDMPLPRNVSSLEPWCSPFKTLSRRVSKLGKCLPPFLAQVVSVLGSGIKKPVKYICKTNQQSNASYACMTPEYLVKFNKKMAFFMGSLHTIHKNVSDNDILPHFCCTVSRLLYDIYHLPSPKCKDPTINASKYVGDMVSLAVSDVVDLMCGSYRSFKTCQEKASSALKFLRENSSDSLENRKASFVRRILNVVERLS
ncbi:uncharacterized protein LOC141849205 isoform X2 [Brevipalpus obovatus]|uniref:uncharacterized protein LOC141849205 isoform X2 n=1 Tax=Brevipalpus obovatus TaxID=246614 RepID=UPI003D9F26FD